MELDYDESEPKEPFFGGNPINSLGWTLVWLFILLPAIWMALEFQERRWLRVLFGLVALLYCGVFVSGVTSIFSSFNYNNAYGFASKSLIDTTVTSLEAGQHDKVLMALKDLQEKFRPTYENRAKYDQLVESAVDKMKEDAPKRP